MKPAVTVSGLTRFFGEVEAVKGLDMEVPAGEIFGLVGPDGAGKTTTIRLLVGILDPTAGEASVLGVPLSRLESVRSRIGYMSQRFGLYEDLTVAENLRFFGRLHGVKGDKFSRRSSRLLTFAGLENFTGRLAGQLSGGMKQKLGLSCALIHSPEILFLDEPTAGVDPVSRREFWRLLYDLLREGVTIFIATSYMDEAQRCSRLGFMHRGTLIHLDTPENIRQSAGKGASLEDAFLEKVSGLNASEG